MKRAPRELSNTLEWFPSRSCFRFKFRDPHTQKVRYLYCTASKFDDAGIDLPSADAVRKNTKKAKGLARRLQTVFLHSLARLTPQPVGSGAPTLSEAAAHYFQLYNQSADYRATLRRIFAEFTEVVGDKPCDKLQDHDLKRFELVLADRVGPVSVRSYIRQLGMLINFIVKKGWVRVDPRLTYRLPRETQTAPNPFSLDELKRFFAVVSNPKHSKNWNHLEWMGIGMLCLGLRPVELEYARWEDVNFDQRFLYVAKSHANKMPQACQNQPIPLIAWPHFVERRQDSGLIWTSFFGGPCTKAAQSRARRSLQNQLPGFTWKRFRKTFATLLTENGNDVVIVSRLLRQSAGGKNVSVAQRHYIGKSDHYLRDTVDEAFASYLGLGPFSHPGTSTATNDVAS